MYKAFVCIHNIFQINRQRSYKSKIMIGIILLIKFSISANSTGQSIYAIAIIPREKQPRTGIKSMSALKLFWSCFKLWRISARMLVLERLVNRHIVVTPRKMACCRRLHPCTCRPGYSRYMHCGVQQQVFG